MKSNNLKELKIKQISESIKNKTLFSIDQLPQKLKDIRTALGMTQQQIAKIENNKQAFSLKTIDKIVKALNLEIKIALVSDTNLEDIIYKQAEKRADQLLMRLNSNMALENQAINKKEMAFQKEKFVRDLLIDRNSTLWEE